MIKTPSHFIPGFLIGGVAGIVFTAVLLLSGPIATRDRIFNETSTDLIQTTQQLGRCSAAYVASHDGKLPKGTVVQGEGRGMIVVGFDPAAPR